jgi:triphosphatase
MTSGDASSILEVEWQFSALDLQPVLDWLGSANVPGYRVTPASSKQLDDTYYDTADWRIHRARFTCRVRRKTSEAELTLKSMADAVESMRSRTELTEPLPLQDSGAPSTAPGACGELIRLISGRHNLLPLFSLRTNRTTFDLLDDSGRLGEIAVDDTVIPVAEDVPARLQRVEVEVDAAAVARAQRFVDLLVAAAGLQPAGTSKFEAALLATGLKVTTPAHSLGTDAVTAEMTAGEAAFAILRKHFQVFLANEASTRVGEDIEGLHDMRVATRRMRAAMGAFAPHLPSRMQLLRTDLGWIAAALGAVRDLDVQIERMAEWRAAAGPDRSHALDGIEALLAVRRQRARKRMLFALDSRRYDRLIERFASTLRRGPLQTFAPGRVPVLAVAPELVEKRYRRVRRHGDPIGPSSPPERFHELRIEAKKLRYALEFVGPVYGKQALAFSARVTALQDVLGLHQDAYVAIAELEEMATTSARELGPAALLAMGAIVERYRLHAGELRSHFAKVYRPLAGSEWKGLQKLMESKRPAGTPPPPNGR